MTTLTIDTSKRRLNLLLYLLVGIAVVLVFAEVATPNLLRSRMAVGETSHSDRQRSQMAEFMSADKAASPVFERVLEAPAPASTATTVDPSRRIIRKAAMEVIVDSPRAAIDRVMQIVQNNGGYVVSSELGGTNERQTGTITLRVPFDKFDATRNELRGIAKSVDSEKVSSDDVTMQYAENEATLRNYRAEEASYLEIMKSSGKISDTLEVARQLSDVRGRIERLQAQIRTMEHQTQMASIAMNLRTEPIAVGRNHWRPLYELQTAWESGLESLATFATVMFGFLLQLPAILAWTVTLIVGGKIAIVLLKRGAMFLGLWKPETVMSAQQ